jgi:nucleoside-diphosphate-sugar epimerase
MRILITGGAGCLGSNLIETWLPRGHEIFVIDNFATGNPEVLPAQPGMTVVEGTVVDRVLIDDVFERFMPTHVVHAAAAYKDPDDWREDARTNIEGTINVAQASRRFGVERIVYLQTALCYGRPHAIPIPVEHPVAPFTSYGISKTAGESYLLMSGVDAVSLRLANVTGPRLAIGPIPTFYKRLKAGEQCFCSDTIRDFLDMEDFVALMDRVIQGSASGVYNVSTGEGHSIKDIFDVVVDHLGVELDTPVPIAPPGADDVPAVVLDPSKTVRELGWTPQYCFEATIRRTLAWYDTHGTSNIHSHLRVPVPNDDDGVPAHRSG